MALRIELILPFVDGVRDTFLTMAGMKVRRIDLNLKQGYAMFGEVSSVIGLSGVTTGTCAVSMPEALARTVVCNMLALPPGEEPEEADVHDAVGELINMIAGCAKTSLSGTKFKFDITLPTIISGGKHEVFIRKKNECVVVVFETDTGQPFALDVCVSSSALQ